MRPPLIGLLCATTFTRTFAIGAFPTLLPELAAGGLVDWQLGLVAGAFGFLRMVADVPVGLFITHHLRRALLVSPLLSLAGLLALTLGGGSLTTLLLGRAVMGVADALGVVAGLAAILRYQTGALASALNAYELSAMLGVLGGTVVAGALPTWLSWNLALLVACAPQLLSVILIPAVLGALPSQAGAGARPFFARRPPGPDAAAPLTAGVALAFAAGIVIAIAYATLDQFVIPLRGSREFGLGRSGVASLLVTAQVCDIACLLPVGMLADRLGSSRVLSVVMLVFGVATALVGFGDFALMVVGCGLFGVGLSGWTLPLGLLRRDTPPGQIGWRTALYRVGVDGGMFLGPFLSGLLAAHSSGLLSGLLAGALLGLSLILLTSQHGGPRHGPPFPPPLGSAPGNPGRSSFSVPPSGS